MTRDFRLGLIAFLAMIVVAEQSAKADDLVVKTDTGTPLKVVVRRDSAIYAAPDLKSANQPARMFEFYYVLKPEPDSKEKLKDNFYRIGIRSDEKGARGWISKDDVVEWPHRQALGLRPAKNRDLTLFYESKDDLKAAYNGTAPPPGPIGREREGGGFALMPILEQFTFKTGEDESHGYRVAYLHASPGSRNSSLDNVVDLSKTSLDVVFVIDTTNSMQPFIDATKKVVAQIADQITKTGGEGAPVRFGLVGYRDVVANPPADWYVAKTICNLEDGKDHKKFQEILGKVEAAGQGSEDFPEDVLAGLKMAIQDAKWNPDGFRHIILIGDASAQLSEKNGKNQTKSTIEGIVALAQPSGREAISQKIVLHSVRVISDASDDHSLCEEHFKKLAAARDYPGEYHEFDGALSTPEFIATLSERIAKASKGLNSARKGVAPASDTPGLGLLVDMMRSRATPKPDTKDKAEPAKKDEPKTKPDTKDDTKDDAGSDKKEESKTKGEVDGKKKDVPEPPVKSSDADSDTNPSFASGFAAEVDSKGNQQVEPFVLVQYGQLELARSALGFLTTTLKNAGDPGGKDVNKIIQNIQILATQVNLGEQVNPNTRPAQILEMILGFPVRNAIFEMSFSKIAAMTEADFQSWVKKVQESEDIMKSHLENNKIWFQLGKETDPQNRHGFIKIKDLP